MKSAWKWLFAMVLGIILMPATQSSAEFIEGDGWPQMNRDMRYGNMWDQFTNRHYGGYNNALTWPGGLWDVAADAPVERRTYANYKGFCIGATNVFDPQYPSVVWPYMVGQRDGWNDGEKGTDLLAGQPDPLAINLDVQFIFKGRLDRRTFRQAYPSVTVDGEINAHLVHIDANSTEITSRGGPWAQLGADSLDAPYMEDRFDPDLPADLTLDTYSWSRMGISTDRRVYVFADRRNDDYMFWHWRMINDGLWGKMGVNTVESHGGTHGTVTGVMMSLMFQWDRSSAGANRTLSSGETMNDSIWRYYGVDYDGAQTEDMRLVYVIDGDQAQTNYDPAHGKQNDIGDPDPNSGALLSAKTGGLQILHYDVSTSDRNDDIAQPRTVGYQNYNNVIRTGTVNAVVGQGHEAKYNQMLLGYQGPSQYYYGPAMTTAERGTHPNAAQFASWIKASNDPLTSGDYWPGMVLGVDAAVTDIEQQLGMGPDDIAVFDTINALYVTGMKGLDEPYADAVGRQWLAGDITDEAKDVLVHSTIDSLFNTMRQAKAVYESADYGGRYAATREEFEATLAAAVGSGILALSPPAPASLDILRRPGSVKLSWTLNTTTGSSIAGYRLYRAEGSFKGDSTFALVVELPPSAAAWLDVDVDEGFSYFYQLTTFDSDGNESTMLTRSNLAAIPESGEPAVSGQPLRFALEQNAPNPFNPTTTIRLSLAQAGETQLDIYNMNGQLVRTLISGNMTAGAHELVWDGTDAVGNAIGSGVYIYRLTSVENVQVRRMVLIR